MIGFLLTPLIRAGFGGNGKAPIARIVGRFD
jgi:hypothetical protein